MPRRPPSVRRGKLIELLEALYRWDVPEQAWLEGLLAPLLAVMPRAAWAAAFTYDVSDFSLKTLSHAVHDPSGVVAGQLERANVHFTQAMIARTFLATAVASVATRPELYDEGSTEFTTRVARESRVEDILTINGVDASGRSACLNVGLVGPASIHAEALRILRRLANHVGSAARVRRKIAAAVAEAQPLPLGGEAIFSAGGRLLHAEGLAKARQPRALLAEAQHLREAARVRADGVDDAAWWPRVDARWTLVDRYESNGARYVVARENTQEAHPLEGLSERERQVVASLASGQSTKEIAFALGIDASTARVLLKRAADKLGVENRRGLLDHPAVKSLRGGVEASELKRIRTS